MIRFHSLPGSKDREQRAGPLLGGEDTHVAPTWLLMFASGVSAWKGQQSGRRRVESRACAPPVSGRRMAPESGPREALLSPIRMHQARRRDLRAIVEKREDSWQCFRKAY